MRVKHPSHTPTDGPSNNVPSNPPSHTSNEPSPHHPAGPSDMDADPEASGSSRHGGRHGSMPRRQNRQRQRRHTPRPADGGGESTTGSDTEQQPAHRLDHATVQRKLLSIVGKEQQHNHKQVGHTLLLGLFSSHHLIA
jgi:hypothetical protein